MTTTDTRPPLTFSSDHTPDVGHLRRHCVWNFETNAPGCGPDQAITVAYEQDRTHLTGASWFLIYRCACGQVVSGSEVSGLRIRHERTRA